MRVLLLRAAEEVFAQTGYAAASTKDLARAAGVTESVLFRHFPTKATLFRESVLDPLMRVLQALSDASSRFLDHPLDDATLMRIFVAELVEQMSTHRAALRSFAVAEDDLDAEARREFHQAMSDVMDRMGAVARAEGTRRGLGDTGMGVEMTARVAVGLVISLVTHDQWLLPTGDRAPTRAQLIDHLTDFMLQGVGYRFDAARR